jgi:UDP-N-acetylglucosamine--N-acetylmuramyl-(pentapeptide) pyrophosphoryl-undecaprenol N-acetylglucosamine transferase
MIPEAELTPARLEKEIRHFMNHPEELERMEEAARSLGKPDAAAKIADLIENLAMTNEK